MTENNLNKIVDKKFIFFIIGFILLLFTTVFFFTRSSLSWTIELSDKGTIGDAIGGITAPLINLLSVVFLYISFRTQIVANETQQKQLIEEKDFNTKYNNFSSLMTVFQSLKDDYNNLSTRNSDGDEIYGKSAINIFINQKFRAAKTKQQLDGVKKSILIKDFLFVVNEYIIVLDRTAKSNLEKDDRNLVLSLVLNFYNTKLDYQLNRFIDLCSEKAILPHFKEKLQECQSLTENIIERTLA